MNLAVVQCFVKLLKSATCQWWWIYMQRVAVFAFVVTLLQRPKFSFVNNWTHSNPERSHEVKYTFLYISSFIQVSNLGIALAQHRHAVTVIYYIHLLLWCKQINVCERLLQNTDDTKTTRYSSIQSVILWRAPDPPVGILSLYKFTLYVFWGQGHRDTSIFFILLWPSSYIFD